MVRSESRRGRRTALAISASLALLALSSPVRADVAACTAMCGSSSGACTVTGLKNIPVGEIVDCSGRDVTVGSTGTVKVTDGFFTLRADDLTVNNGGVVLANEATPGTPVGFHLDLTGNVTVIGALRANNDAGGSEIILDADGNVVVSESGTDGIEANGVGSGDNGGTVQIHSGGNVTLYDPIRADGGNGGTTWGGSVEVEAEGNISTGLDGKVLVGGRQGGAGTIRMTAKGDLAGTDGDITIGAELEAEGFLDEGDGGEIHLIAKDKIQLNGLLSARGGVEASGGTAVGGSVLLDAGCSGIQINANIDVRGGEGSGLDGGAVVADSSGAIALKSGKSIISEATANAGVGGDVSLTSKSKITIEGTAIIDANGDPAVDGRGGNIEVSGCTVEVGSGAILDAKAYESGSITLSAAKTPGTPRLAAGLLQPLVVHSGSSLRVAGNANGSDGEITLGVSDAINGCCTNSAAGTCSVCIIDTPSCVFGCDTGDCDDANPDTDGVTAQFDRAPRTIETSDTSNCTAACQ